MQTHIVQREKDNHVVPKNAFSVYRSVVSTSESRKF